jgi:uncharacterized membrane protein YidH (DUF202 family)
VSDSTGGVRDHLANERTQLAWLRTSANVIVVGLAVARFADGGDMSTRSLVAGTILLLTGAVGVVYGTLRYRSVAAALRQGDAGVAASSFGPSVAAVVLLVAAVAATLVLLIGA